MWVQEIDQLNAAYQASLGSTKLQPVNKTPLDFEDGFVEDLGFSSKAVLFYGSYKLLLEASDIDKIASDYLNLVIHDDTGRLKFPFKFLLDMLTTRLKNYSRPDRVPIISLGEDCLPRTLATRWGMKLPRLLGELTCPFDLSVHPIEGVAEILKSSFSNYLQRSDIRFDQSLNHPINSRYGILWNHETGVRWTEDNFQLLDDLYERRIKNFNKLTREKPSVAFLYVSKSFDISTVHQIARSIGEISNGKATLAVLNSYQDQVFPVGLSQIGDVRIFHKHHPTPHRWYLWWSHEHFTLPEGHIWERSVIDWLQSVCDNISINQ